jgi:ribosomal-protein-alanine N-acetyltransferase
VDVKGQGRPDGTFPVQWPTVPTIGGGQNPEGMEPVMDAFRTERLNLEPLSPARLRTYLEDPGRLERELRYPVSRPILTGRVRGAIRMKLERMVTADVRDHVWITYWLIIIRDAPFGAGLAGFKGVPDVRGEVEIGYGIDPAYRNRGYMTETVRGMIAWAFGEERCRSVVALDVDRRNAASRRVLEKNGLAVFAETAESLSYRIRRGE